MNYLSRRTKHFLVKTGALLFILLVLHLVAPIIRPYVHTLATLAWKEASALREDLVVLEGLASETKSDLIRRVSALEERNAKLSSEILALKIEMNQEALLCRSAGTQQTPVRALVLSKPGYSPYGTLVIDAGEDRGVLEGDSVLVGSIVIGKVTTTYETTSHVELLSAPNSVHQVVLKDGTSGDAYGAGGGMLTFQIPVGIDSAPGDPVFDAQTFKLIGLVGDVVQTDEDVFQNIFIRIPVNIYTLMNVEVQTYE